MKNKISSKIVIVLVIIIEAFVGISLSACANDDAIILNSEREGQSENGDLVENDFSADEQNEVVTENITEESVNDLLTKEKELVVHIGGEVTNPGVYELAKGSRLIDAINAAGGFSDSADTEYENLASFLEDGAQYIILSKDEAEKKRDSMELAENANNSLEQSHYNKDGVLNINLASKDELMKLDGIGESKAEKIIEYRKTKGKFKSIEDLKNVSGIGNNIFNGISSSITVD